MAGVQATPVGGVRQSHSRRVGVISCLTVPNE